MRQQEYVTAPDPRGVGTVRYPRLVPNDTTAVARFKKHTLTNLYNDNPAWLANAHRDGPVAAYGWPPGTNPTSAFRSVMAESGRVFNPAIVDSPPAAGESRPPC